MDGPQEAIDKKEDESMSAAVATTTDAPLSGSSARRNSSSSSGAASSTTSQRCMSGAVPPPAPMSAGGSGPHRSSGGSSNPTATRMTSLAQAAAAATAAAEAERAKNRAARSKAATATASITQKPKPRGAKQQRDVMARNRVVRAPTAVDPDDSVYLTISVLGLKFRCLVQTEWPCEAMIATAIAEYHLAYPKCEIPDFNTIYHMEKGDLLPGAESIGRWCVDNDEIELGIAEKSASANESVANGGRGGSRSLASSASSEDTRETFEFTIMFHRLPLGFTLKQNNENIVVANIYPHSTATHYERLETGVTVVQIADTPLENLGLRQVHDLIKNASIPLEIHFRGYKKPSLRASLLLAAAAKPAAKPEESETPERRQSVLSPKSEDDNNDGAPSSTRTRARTTSGASSGKKAAEQAVPVSEERPAKSPHSNSKQRLTSERKKTNASSPYPERRAFAAGKRSGRSQRNTQQDKEESELLKSLEICDNQSNHGSDGAARVVTSSVKSNGRREKQSPAKKTRRPSPSPVVDGGNEEPADVRDCDRDSNQNEDETEELLVDHIKMLQIALLKKHEEAKQIARQIELFHEKLSAVRSRNGTEVATNPPPLSSSSSAPIPSSSSHLKLRLTPEVLEAMDSKAGVPPKSASYYQSSNVSSISGYSNYSSRSNAPRSARTARRENMRSDVSVASYSSATSERRHSNPRSPRSQCIKNINNRYSYIPQKYSATSTETPTSLSSRGAVMSRARATRDSFITKSESPGVGYYDVKLTSHVKGGEIGDSDRALPWP